MPASERPLPLLPDAPARNAAGQKRALGWAVILACVGSALALYPLSVPLILAVWLAALARPVFSRLRKALGGRARAAGALAVALVVAIVAPTAVVVANLAQSATELATVIAKPGQEHRLRALVQDDGDGARQPLPANAKQLTKLAKEHGEESKDLAKGALLFTAGTLIFLFILAFGLYAVLAEGQRGWAWALDHSPLRRDLTERLAEAFQETGRGLLASVGITAALQGVLCTVTYFALGIPRAWVLGFVSAAFSIMPVVGTPLVWGPLAIGLAMSGETTKAIILLVVGGGVIALIENLVSPFFARIAKFKLNTFLLVASMFGGTLAFGPAGLMLGPLVMRLAQEGLAIARDEGLIGKDTRALV